MANTSLEGRLAPPPPRLTWLSPILSLTLYMTYERKEIFTPIFSKGFPQRFVVLCIHAYSTEQGKGHLIVERFLKAKG